MHEARRWAGSFLLDLDGLDALVFTGGIGENSAAVRAGVCAGLGRLGVALDRTANEAARGREAELTAPGAAVRVLVIPANEELVVAREVVRFLGARGAT